MSILPHLSKPFQRILYDQIDSQTKDLQSKYQGGFRKKFSSQHSLLDQTTFIMFEKRTKVQAGALLVDLSKASDFIVHLFYCQTKRIWFWL